MGKMNKSSKGFFFVLISFILVMYIFLYLTAWMNAMEISEKTASEKFRAATLEGIVSQLSEQRFAEFFDIAGYYAFFKIDDFASDPAHPLRYNSSDEIRYLRHAFNSTVFTGESGDFEGQNLTYSEAEKRTYTFGAWLDNLNKTLTPAGLEVKNFEIYNTSFNQTGPVTFNASMDIYMFVQDRLNSTLSITRRFHVQEEFNITGLADPMIKREYRKLSANTTVERQIFLNAIYDSPSKLAPKAVINGTMGQGFFYGPMVAAKDVTCASPSESDKIQYIIVGNFSDIQAACGWQQFGAYIVTNNPVMETMDGCSPKSETQTFMAVTYQELPSSSTCSLVVDTGFPSGGAKPFAVIPGFKISDFRGPKNSSNALMIAKYAPDEVGSDNDSVSLKYYPVAAYDLEALRDATVCSYFIPSERAPSFAQRLSKNAPYLNSTFGMETLLVGKWAGGTDLTNYDNRSRVDFEFFQNTPPLDAEKVRGMPGCKSFPMCVLRTGDDAPLGHFRMSDDSLALYGADKIACNDGRSRCDP
ncbi:Uncharacterised protein [uncultured archaeon]|nr:Uncharacterised protein [uncultured archaeon]